jgi:aspartate carbamoyltransferase regulatory subunit
MEMERELKVRKIEEGTVIDHITSGNALSVLRILGITGREPLTVSVLMNVPSKKMDRKDIVKIEGRELNPQEVDKIALIAPRATINIIRNYKVVSKKRVKLPSTIRGIIRCTSPTCISNSSEPIHPLFKVERESPLELKCYYCGRLIKTTEGIFRS